MKRSLVFFAVSFLFYELIPRAQQRAEPAVLEGIVTRFGTNEPLANATVELRSTGGGRGYPNLGIAPSVNGPVVASTRTDRDGKYSFSLALTGDYRLDAV